MQHSSEALISSPPGVLAVLCSVAAHRRPNLVPAATLMALLGYALGNYLAPLTGQLASIAAGQ